jgi:ribosomal protein S10
MCSRVTHIILLNIHDQYMNNFDMSKHTRLTGIKNISIYQTFKMLMCLKDWLDTEVRD